MPPPQNKTSLRFRTVDVVVLGTIGALAVWIVLRPRGYTHAWDLSVLGPYILRRNAAGGLEPGLLIEGFIHTVRLSVWGILLACAIGTAIGLTRTSRRLLHRLIGWAYVGSIRNLPPLVLVFLFYYFVSRQLIGPLGLEAVGRLEPGPLRSVLATIAGPPARFPAFVSAVITLAIYEGAYIAEIVRAGIESIERGQWEAASALGLSRRQRMRHVIGPQALRRIMPALGGQFISTVKDSAIVSVISVPELTFQGKELMATRPSYGLEIWVAVAAMYLVLTLGCSVAVRRLERQ